MADARPRCAAQPNIANIIAHGPLQEVVEEEMGHVTDEEGPKPKRKGKKNGMKPGQALSFTGLEPRKWDGVDMLDMKQVELKGARAFERENVRASFDSEHECDL